MTNGTVADVTDINGRAVTLTYDNGQTKKISIPDGTPVVTFAPAAAADLKPSATVFVTAQREADGTLSASRVVVETKVWSRLCRPKRTTRLSACALATVQALRLARQQSRNKILQSGNTDEKIQERNSIRGGRDIGPIDTCLRKKETIQ